MSLIIATIFLIILLGISVLMAVCTIDNFWRTVVVQNAPFVPVPKKIIPHIVNALHINQGSMVYDLGCGDARILAACHAQYPAAFYQGIDVAFLPRFLAWIRLQNIQKPHTITIRKGNFFKEDISDATHIFVYLFPKVMDDLLPKFQKECKKGTRIVSCDFQFKHKDPVETIDLRRSEHALGRRLYVYEM
ncbi:hypothetical protein HYW94_03400 [Candidatus Uhrbacteria bacterium]|nr:hypothetical protein [Candidatus Uhrbacteria bacterium]